MARIVFEARMVTPRMHGISRYAFHLLQQLLRLDTDNQYVVLRNGPFLEQTIQRERLVTLDPGLKLYGLKELVAIPRVLERLGADLYYSPTYFAPPLAPCPHIQTVHDLTQLWQGHRTWRYRAYYDLVVRRAVHRAACVVTETRFVAGQLRRRFGLPAGRIAVVPSGAGLECERLPDPSRRPEVLCLVNEKPHKNAIGALRAVERLRGLGHPVRLALVGRVPERLANTVARLSWVEHLPFVDQDELVRRYRQAALLLFPSFSEGFGYPPLEAMIAGTPVVSSDASCMPEVLGDAALYADPASPEQMATQMARVLSSPDLAEELAERGVEQAARYSWESMGRQVLAVIRRALALCGLLAIGGAAAGADGQEVVGPLVYRSSGVELGGKRIFWKRIGKLKETAEDLQAAYQKRLAATPDSAAGWIGLGRWCAKRRMEPQARAAYRKAIALEPANAAARAGGGFVRRKAVWLEATDVLAERRKQLSSKSHDRRVELADWCREHGLFGEQYQLLVEVLVDDGWHTGAIRRMERILARRRPRTVLSPPFDGRWIAWVDSTRHHKAKVFALFAIDFLKVDAQGRPWSGRIARRLTDYHGFGARVYAAADGTVIHAVDEHKDMPPRRLGSYKRSNSVTIRHANGEFTLYGHLKQGSLAVKVGQQVKRGQLLGQVGNSGRSGTPHLHFTMMMPAYAGGRGVYLSVPYYFRGFELVEASKNKCKIDVVQARPQEGWIIVCPIPG